MSPATGFVSDYNDSGYTLDPINQWMYTQDPSTSGNGTFVSGSINVAGNDIYTSGLSSIAGVYLINGGYNSNCTLYPILCSTTKLSDIFVPTNSDDAWLVYPGFGIQLFQDSSYSTGDTYTYLSYNLGTEPLIFACGGSGFADVSTNSTLTIYEGDGATYPKNITSSMYVYYRGTQIVIPGFTS